MANSEMTLSAAQKMAALQDAIYLIGGKWRIPIFRAISNGNHRFTDILDSIPGITRRSLAKELKEMEMNYLVTKTVHFSSPLLIEYHTTEYCETFYPVINELVRLAIEHKKKVLTFSKPIKKLG